MHPSKRLIIVSQCFRFLTCLSAMCTQKLVCKQCHIVNSHRSTHSALTVSNKGIMHPRHYIHIPYIHPPYPTLRHHTQPTSHDQNHTVKNHDDHNHPRPRSFHAHPSAPTHLPHPPSPQHKLHPSHSHPLKVKHNIALPAQHRRAQPQHRGLESVHRVLGLWRHCRSAVAVSWHCNMCAQAAQGEEG
jgi:hypothetical protein